MDFLATLRRQVAEFFSKMEKGQLLRMAVLLVLAIGISITAIVLLTRVEYAALPTSGNAADMGKINERLQEMGVPTKPGGGNTIMVPKDQVETLTWQLASDGLFESGSSYEWLLQGTGLGVTQAAQEAFAVVQTSENLRSIINALPKVADSQVILNIERDPVYVFDPGRKESTAAVMIYLKSADAPLTENEASGLRALIRMAGGGLSDEMVTLMDNAGNTYDASWGEVVQDVTLGDRLAYQRQIEDHLSRQLVRLFEAVYGFGNVSAQVSAEVTFDKVTQQSIVFEPPVPGEITGIPISMKTLAESYRTGETLAQGEPGLDENGGAPSYVEDSLLAEDLLYSKVSEEVNMEVNETKTWIESAEASLVKLTAAVILPAEEGVEVDEDVLEIARNLVAHTIGATNLDYVTVAFMPMDDSISPAIDAWQRNDELANDARMQRLILILAAIVVVVLLLLIALRILLRAIRPPQPVLAADAGPMLVDYNVGDALPQEEMVSADLDETDDSAGAQILRYVDKDAEAIAQLLRNWLSEDYR